MDNKQGSGGQLYRRNRYLDPQTGRFTQEDPIGLAGGLNLYGYAGGDAVNFSDPFGLCRHRTGVARIMNVFDAPCETRDEAARQALAEVRGNLWIQRREYGGEIIADPKGGFRYVTPRMGRTIKVGIKTKTPGYEGGYHSHPPLEGYVPEEFSGLPGEEGGDRALADNTGKPVYLLTPSGRMLRYDPDPKKQRRGREVIIGTTESYE